MASHKSRTKYTKAVESVETMGRGRFSICRPLDGYKYEGCRWYITDNARLSDYLHNDGNVKHSAVVDGSQAWYKSREAARKTVRLFNQTVKEAENTLQDS
jgi:hypothetical protein